MEDLCTYYYCIIVYPLLTIIEEVNKNVITSGLIFFLYYIHSSGVDMFLFLQGAEALREAADGA